MNGKILAVFMSLIMVASAVAICVPATSEATETGTADNPYYIVGNSVTPAVLHKGSPFNAKIDFNEAAYDLDGDVAFKVSFNDGDYSAIKLGKAVNNTSGSYKVTISETSSVGVYDVKFEFVKSMETAVKTMIEIDLTTIFNGETLTLNYYYAANISTNDSASDNGVITLESLDTDTAQINGDVVSVYKGLIPEIDVELSYNSKVVDKSLYSVYASGLPAGLSVKVNTTDGKANWIITGKADSSIVIDEDKGYNDYAVVINTVDNGGNINTKSVTFRLYPSAIEFSYGIVNDDGDVETYNEDTTRVIKAGESIELKTLDPTGKSNVNVSKVYYTANGEMEQLQYDSSTKSYTYTSDSDDTGVIEIVMENEDESGVYKVQHKVTVLIVGEIVHSGLNPVVTSS